MTLLNGWRRSRSLLATSTLILALASGAAITVWSALRAYILAPLPFPDLNRLVTIWEVDPGNRDIWRAVTTGNFADWRRDQKSFEGFAAGINRSFTLTSFEDSVTPLMREVSFGYFEVLGVKPQLGRTFSREEEREGGPPVVMLSHDLWTQRFGASTSVLGETTGLDGIPHEIVGVLPKGHSNPVYLLDVTAQAYVPLRLTQRDREMRRSGGNGLVVFGRLKDGVDVAQAQAEMNSLMAISRAEHKAALGPTEALITPAAERFVRPVRPALYVVAGSVLLLLLVACGNVANLLLLRAAGRRQEMGVRRALGASPRDLVQQGLRESLVPGILGSIGGLAVAWVGVRAAAAVIPVSPGLPRVEFGLDASALLFSLGVALVTSVLCGLFPALAATRVDAAAALASGSKGAGTEGSRGRIKEFLLAAEVAMAVTLLLTGAMVYRSLQNLESLQKGFDTRNALTFRVAARGPAYQEPAARIQFFTKILEEFRSIPGVESVGSSLQQPFMAAGGFQIFAVGGLTPAPEGLEPRALLRPTQPGFFEAFGTRMVSGRDISEDDRGDSEPVAVVNEALVRRFLAGKDPLSSSVVTRDGQTRRIVGVVQDVRANGDSPLPVPALFVPLRQDPSPAAMAFILRTRDTPTNMLAQVEARVRQVDPRMPVFFVQTLDRFVESLDAPTRFLSALMVAFAAMAVVLALVGTYAVVSYATTQRKREFGLRVALGASPANLATMVLKGAGNVTAIGIALGCGLSLLAGRLIEGRLFQVSPFDPGMYLAGALAVSCLMLLAAASPALRAARVNAAVTLKEG
jgi:predicted permease